MARPLEWNRAVIAWLVREGPPNQTRILAVAAACISHANADGTRMEAGIRRLATETGQRYRRVVEAMDSLIDAGFLTLARRIAHGGRRFTLTIPQAIDDEADQRSGSRDAKGASDPVRATLEPFQRSGEGNAENGQRSPQRSPQRSGEGNEPPTSEKEEEEGRRFADATPPSEKKERRTDDEDRRAAEIIEAVAQRLNAAEGAEGTVDEDNDDLRAEAIRLTRLGFTPESVIRAKFNSKPPRRIGKPTGLALARLRRLNETHLLDPRSIEKLIPKRYPIDRDGQAPPISVFGGPESMVDEVESVLGDDGDDEEIKTIHQMEKMIDQIANPDLARMAHLALNGYINNGQNRWDYLNALALVVWDGCAATRYYSLMVVVLGKTPDLDSEQFLNALDDLAPHYLPAALISSPPRHWRFPKRDTLDGLARVEVVLSAARLRLAEKESAQREEVR